MFEVLESYHLLSRSAAREENWEEKVDVETRRLSLPVILSTIKSRMAAGQGGSDLSLMLPG